MRNRKYTKQNYKIMGSGQYAPGYTNLKKQNLKSRTMMKNE